MSGNTEVNSLFTLHKILFFENCEVILSRSLNFTEPCILYVSLFILLLNGDPCMVTFVNSKIPDDFLFDFILYIPVNNFSVMSGWVPLG